MKKINSVRMNLVDSILMAPTRLARAWFALTELAASAVQATLERAAGIAPASSTLTPLAGPRDLDHALSELANRTLRIIHFAPMAAEAIPGAIREVAAGGRFFFSLHGLARPTQPGIGAGLALFARDAGSAGWAARAADVGGNWRAKISELHQVLYAGLLRVSRLRGARIRRCN